MPSADIRNARPPCAYAELLLIPETLSSLDTGDPEIRGFDGNAFQFEGQAGSFYEALGGAGHQV